MVVEAIVALKERNGSSRTAIKKYILDNFKAEINYAVFARAYRVALANGVKSGKLTQVKQSFKVSAGTKAKAAKKSKAKTAKTATKKASTSKKASTKKTSTKKASTKKTSTKKASTKKATKKTSTKKAATKKATKKKSTKKATKSSPSA